MAKIDWDGLKTLDDWSGALQTLIAGGKAAVQGGSQDEKIAVQSQLADFIERAPAFCAPLVPVARDAGRALFEAVVSKALADLAARDADLRSAVAAIRGGTEKADKSARSIQFKQAIDVLDRSKAALDELKKLQEQLAAPDQNVLAKIRAVNAAIDDLKTAVKA
jgi:hypothetical protein